MKKLISILILSFNLCAYTYTTAPAFMDLYQAYVGPDQIGSALNKALVSDTPRQLIHFSGSEVTIYDTNKKIIAKETLRTKPNSGFFEVTAVSHIGPAMSYLLELKTLNKPEWKSLAQNLLNKIKAAKTSNQNNWVQQLKEPSWSGHEAEIQNMLDYGLRLSENYLTGILNGQEFSQTTLDQNFFKSSSKDFPIGFNQIMVGTFMLAGLEGSYRLHSLLDKANIDWPNVMVVMQFIAGSNVTAGLTKESNWFHQFLINESKQKLPDNHIIYPAYAERKDDYDYYAGIWSSAYIRSELVAKVFSNIQAIERPDPKPIPGDYRITQANDIDSLLRRVRYSFEHPTQFLSNSVGFWLAGEGPAKNWDVTKIEIPGLTTGFPKGISSYPAMKK